MGIVCAHTADEQALGQGEDSQELHIGRIRILLCDEGEEGTKGGDDGDDEEDTGGGEDGMAKRGDEHERGGNERGEQKLKGENGVDFAQETEADEGGTGGNGSAVGKVVFIVGGFVQGLVLGLEGGFGDGGVLSLAVFDGGRHSVLRREEGGRL